MEFIEKSRNFVIKHADWFTFAGLCIVFYFMFFHNIGNYALMDADETRYAAMSKEMFRSKDFLTLYLNGNYFFEKPPLYFWGECLSFAVFGKITEFSVRFPVALYGTLLCFLVYFTGKKVISRSYGVISALVLASSLEFVILSKFAILDIVLAACIGFALCFGMLTYFCEEKNKKYFWQLFYLFSGLAVLAKGIPGLIIPFGSMFLITLFTKNFKDAFKPKYFLIGIFIFLLVVLPWHLVMLKIHNPLFFNEYIVKHHLERFFNSNEIGREQPWWFFLVTLLWGLVPWIFSILSVFTSKIKKFNKDFLKFPKVSEFDNAHKFIFFNAVTAIFTLLFLSSSSTKLITYILPIFVPVSFLIGMVWKNYIEEGVNKKAVDISVYVWGGICILASVIALFMPLFLKPEINEFIGNFKWFCIILLFVFGISSILFAKANKRTAVFASYVIFMLILSAFGTRHAYNIDYKFGQNELMNYAKYIKANHKKLYAFRLNRKYSLLYYYDDKITYGDEKDYESLDKALADDDYLIIVKNKQTDEMDENIIVDYDIIKQGKRYSIIKGR